MYLTNIFGEVPEKNITFVIDSSGSMYDVLAHVKDHVTQLLIDRAYNRPGTTFNIIDFSSEITQWADRMVECTPTTVNAATRWLRGIETKTGSDALTALQMAFDEPRCDGIYLVTDGMPDQDPNEIVFKVTKASQGRPVHSISVTDRDVDVPTSSRMFLENLAMNTRGSFHVVCLSHVGDVKKVTPVYNATYAPKEGLKKCSVEATLTSNPYLNALSTIPSELPPYVPFYRYYPYVHTEVIQDALERTPVASVVARGTKILARRDEDGYYYPAHIAQEVSGNRHRFLIEFDRTKKGRDLRMQETALHDIIALNDALRHSVVADDKVLAPWESDGKRYGPGKVVRGVEKRHTVGDERDSDVVVSFWNGKTVTVPKGVAIWIPELLYDRIVVELQMPITARKEIIDSQEATDLPSGYPSLPSYVDDVIKSAPWDPLVTMRRHIQYYPWLYRGMYYLPTYPLLTPVPRLLNSWPDLIFNRPDLLYGTWPWPFYPENVLPYRRRYPITQPKLEGSDLSTKDLSDLVDRQLEEFEVKDKMDKRRRRKMQIDTSSGSNTPSDSDSDFEEDDLQLVPYPTMINKGTNTKTSYLRSSKNKDRPEWKKYWPQTPQPRNHHQPDFYKRPTGMFSTWKEPDFGSYEGPMNTGSAFHMIDQPNFKSDRVRMMEHLKTPYVERPEHTIYAPKIGANDFMHNRHQDRMQHLGRRHAAIRTQAWADKETDVMRRTNYIEDTKRQQALMRIGSDVEKQRQYEKRLAETIEAKAKINQSFRNGFYQKELDHLNRQQSHADWLQGRRRNHERQQWKGSFESEQVQQSRELGRQYRQAKHHAHTVRRLIAAEEKNAMSTLGSV
uniref:Uncharacterized protein LOC104266709 n=1 Tax=Phallusia mammillata TaxID=59560 RepID=A0A6F9DJT8_9ASCI|nr:uncharacterized protein LOC104266709 [Phallusia mammillata]